MFGLLVPGRSLPGGRVFQAVHRRTEVNGQRRRGVEAMIERRDPRKTLETLQKTLLTIPNRLARKVFNIHIFCSSQGLQQKSGWGSHDLQEPLGQAGEHSVLHHGWRG